MTFYLSLLSKPLPDFHLIQKTWDIEDALGRKSCIPLLLRGATSTVLGSHLLSLDSDYSGLNNQDMYPIFALGGLLI
jgi:hypothetical protein